MCPPMEPHPDFVLANGDVGRHIDQVAEDLPRLSIFITTHAASHDAIQAAGHHQKRHVEVDLEADR